MIVVFEGMGAAGKGVQINRLIQALDPRGFDVYAFNRAYGGRADAALPLAFLDKDSGQGTDRRV